MHTRVVWAPASATYHTGYEQRKEYLRSMFWNQACDTLEATEVTTSATCTVALVTASGILRVVRMALEPTP